MKRSKSTTAVATTETINKEVEAKTLYDIREVSRNIRKFSYISNSVFQTLKTSKKEMLQKEIASMTELVNQL